MMAARRVDGRCSRPRSSGTFKLQQFDQLDGAVILVGIELVQNGANVADGFG